MHAELLGEDSQLVLVQHVLLHRFTEVELQVFDFFEEFLVELAELLANFRDLPPQFAAFIAADFQLSFEAQILGRVLGCRLLRSEKVWEN